VSRIGHHDGHRDGPNHPSDIGIGNNVLVVPTGSTVTAFG
jgi:hypothetical protein